jgi:hypothetical protein
MLQVKKTPNFSVFTDIATGIETETKATVVGNRKHDKNKKQTRRVDKTTKLNRPKGVMWQQVNGADRGRCRGLAGMGFVV